VVAVVAVAVAAWWRRSMNDFSLVLMSLAKPGLHVKVGDVVVSSIADAAATLDDYKDTVVQTQTTSAG